MKPTLLLGYDIGTSSIKASVVDATTGATVASAQYPDTEAAIITPHPGWAEQDPRQWWDSLLAATQRLGRQLASTSASLADVSAIGISYQMHGLVCVDKAGESLRNAIIWCDGRAVSYGEEAFRAIGAERCLTHLLNSPGNFTASKLAWVKENEPEIFSRIHRIMLPGDYIAMRLSGGAMQTTVSGLSEGMFWDFATDSISADIMSHYGFSPEILPDIVPTFAPQCHVSPAVASELGIPANTPVSYRGGDQPNNALSLNVMRPGEIAATGGTSGVVYGILDTIACDTLSRVNTFAHVNHTAAAPRLGVLLCINGTGILNAWMRRTVAPDGISYPEMNALAASVPVGSDGISVAPFGNGTERMLRNAAPGASVHGIEFNRHTKAHLLRAAQEGIAFSFAYGMQIMQQMGMHISTIKAGHANLFLSPIFRKTLATVAEADIHLYQTDGSVGAAYGAGIGAHIFADADEAFATLKRIDTITPDPDSAPYKEAYQRWTDRCL